MHPISAKPARLNNIVVLRALATIAVVIYHCYCPWMKDGWNWVPCPIDDIYSYILRVALIGRMPLFIFVSGYLFAHLILDRGKYATLWGFVKNKFERLLVPFFVFCGIMGLIFHQDYIGLILFPRHHLWFLEMLFWCFMTGWILNRFVRWTPLRLLMLGCAVAMTNMHGSVMFALPFYRQYFVFFYGGYLFYAYRDKLRFIFRKYFAVGLIFAYLSILVIMLSKERISDMIGDGNASRVYEYIMFFLKIISVLLALILVEYYLRRRTTLPGFFTRLNNISYGIYLFHQLILELLHRFLYQKGLLFILEEHYISTPPILCILVLGLSIVICCFLKQYRWSKWVIG